MPVNGCPWYWEAVEELEVDKRFGGEVMRSSVELKLLRGLTALQTDDDDSVMI